MKTYVRAWVVAVGLAVLVAGCGGGESETGAGAPATDALERLGLDEATAQRHALDTLASGQAWAPVAAVGRAFKALPDDERSAVVRELGGWLRRYVESESFANAYGELRRSRLPAEVTYDESVDEAVERWQEESFAQLEETRTNVLPLLPEADRAGMLESLEQMAAQFEDPQMIALHRQSIEMQREQDRQSYETSMADWKASYPEDPALLVKTRIEEFLAMCADVDFDADLREQDGRLKFVDAAYEAKPSEWKWCFRAGEHSVAAARTLAQDWLEDLD